MLIEESIPELTEPRRVELERRWRAFEQSPDEGEPWDDVKQSLLKRMILTNVLGSRHHVSDSCDSVARYAGSIRDARVSPGWEAGCYESRATYGGLLKRGGVTPLWFDTRANVRRHC